MKPHQKIKVIRVKLLNMNQSEFACAVGSKQKDVSLLEKGKKEFIPKRYLEYFAKEGVDLNSLFHPEKEVSFLSSDQ